MASGHESIQLPDTQVPDAGLAIEASADVPETQVPLEDERQAILTCAHAVGGCTRAGGYNRLFQISSCASPPYHPTCVHARCARNLEASQTHCDDAEKPVARNLDTELDVEATIPYDPDLAKDLFGDDKPEAPACTYRFAALLDIAVTTAIGITGSWQYTNPLSI